MISNLSIEDLEKKSQDLEYTQDIRRKIIDSITDSAINEKDPKLLSISVSALDSMDKSTLGVLKLNEKRKENETKANESEALSKYLISLSNEKIRQKRNIGHNPEVDKPLPELLSKSFDVSQLEVYTDSESTNEFMSRMENSE